MHGSSSIADLIPDIAASDPRGIAIRHKREGEWREVTYEQVDLIVREIGLGLIDLGLQRGDRICILANTRPEWSYVDMAVAAAGGIVVPIYQTNSPEECLFVIDDSTATMIVVEDSTQLRKIVQIRDRLPRLSTVIVIDPPTEGAPAGEISLAEVRERGRDRSPEELDRRRGAVRPEDPFTFIYTSGTTGPPKGCVLSHGNYRAIVNMIREIGQIGEEDVIYLYLPLAHSFALLIQLAAFDLGATIAYFGGDTKQIVSELMEVRPTYLPSVPRIFEKIYTLARATIEAQPPQERERSEAAIAIAGKVRYLQRDSQPIPTEMRASFQEADEGLFANIRAIFGGRLRQATTGAAPIAAEILEFFWACGVPVMEGYGMTETATAATVNTIDHHRFGTVGRPFPHVKLAIAPDGEVLIKGPNVFNGYHNSADTSFGSVQDGWLYTGDLGLIDDDGYLSITGRKKDIIITAGGKNLTPANIENDLRQCRWISQAVMLGDGRPYPIVLITLDEEEIAGYASGIGLTSEVVTLHKDPAIRALIESEVARVNSRYAQVEQAKRFEILDHDLSLQTGELTPTLKVKRNVVIERYAEIIEGLYAE